MSEQKDNSNTQNGLLVQLIPGVFVIPGITNIGVVTENTGSSENVYLIDSGSNNFQAKSILSILDNYFSSIQKKIKIKAIFNTHSHADHTGGNEFIKDQTGCEIWMSKNESFFNLNTNIQGSIISGSYPFSELQMLFCLKTPLSADKIINDTLQIQLADGKTISFINLPGHYFDDIGILINNNIDKILFAGDAVFSGKDSSKYWLHFMLQPDKFLESLEKIKNISRLSWCIPSHGIILSESQHQIADYLDICKATILQNKKDILTCLENNKLTTEQIMKKLAEKNKTDFNFILYNLVHFTIKSYLAWLKKEKLISPEIIDNELLWCLL